MSEPVIRVENLSKKYIIGHQKEQRYTTLRDALAESARSIGHRVLQPFRAANGFIPRTEEFWALKDITFEVKQGERLGIIGRNGAGKSTLLKVLSRITEPTTGRVTLKGRVASLLEVGTGFHPELTGRENIYLNGAILGMARQEIQRKFDEIVDFSGVEKFIDTPVKRYSSGMYVRLAFAVAAHLEPEILLVDEVLAVGDAQFQKKCLGKMEEVAEEGRTILFVSHNMAAVEALCSQACLLVNGNLALRGSTNTVIDAYFQGVQEKLLSKLADRKDRSGNSQLVFTDISLQDESGTPLMALVTGKEAQILLKYQANDSLKNVSVSIGFYGKHGQFLLLCNNEMTGQPFQTLPADGVLKCTIPKLPLSPGIYMLNIYSEVNGILADWVREAYQLTITEGDYYGTGKIPPNSHGGFLIGHSWAYEEGS